MVVDGFSESGGWFQEGEIYREKMILGEIGPKSRDDEARCLHDSRPFQPDDVVS